METVEYYNDIDTACYLLLLDASKAFDRVEYVKLLTILRDRKICPLIYKYVNVMLINIKYILWPVKVNYYVFIQVLVPKVKI